MKKVIEWGNNKAQQQPSLPDLHLPTLYLPRLAAEEEAEADVLVLAASAACTSASSISSRHPWQHTKGIVSLRDCDRGPWIRVAVLVVQRVQRSASFWDWFWEVEAEADEGAVGVGVCDCDD